VSVGSWRVKGRHVALDASTGHMCGWMSMRRREEGEGIECLKVVRQSLDMSQHMPAVCNPIYNDHIRWAHQS
jgi:hypothetical protein